MVSTDERKAQFKKGINDKDNRRHRNDVTINIRKAKKEQGLAKRRPTFNQQQHALPVQDHSVKFLANYVAGVNAADRGVNVEAVRAIRKILSDEQNPPVQEVIQTGVLPQLVKFLSVDDPLLQFEAAWALTNVASSQFTRVVCDLGAVPVLVQLMSHANADVREQTAWCLGNIAGDCSELRDAVLECGALASMLANAQQPSSPTMLRTITWALSNLCRGKPAPAPDSIYPCLPMLVQLMRSDDEEVLADAAWAVSYLSDGCNEKIDTCLQAGVLPEIIRLMSHPSSKVVVPALRNLGNIVSGTQAQTQAVLDSRGLQVLLPLLQKHNSAGIKKEACWALSNIAAGTKEQVSTLLSAPHALSSIIDQLQSAPHDVKKEAAWTIANIASSGTPAHTQQLAAEGAVAPLCEMLGMGDARVVKVVLEALEMMLQLDAANGSNEFTVHIDEVGGLDKIEALQQHENTDIYEMAVRLIETYYGSEDDECENIAPVVAANAQTFAFGVPTSAATTLFKQESGPGFNFHGIAT
jgi:hypothetical protein